MDENNVNQSTPIQEPTAPVAGQPVTPPAAPLPQAPIAQPIPTPAPETQMPSSMPTTPQQRSKTGNKTMLIAINAIVIIVFVLGGLYMLALKGSQTTNAPSSTAEPTQTATPTPSETTQRDEDAEIQTLDLGDPTTDLQVIDSDLQQL